MTERPLAQDEVNGKKVEYSLITGDNSQTIKAVWEDGGKYFGKIFRINDFSEFLEVREKVTALL